MKPHKGMRPQDVVILLKIIAKGNVPWQNKDLASELSMSSSEITESLNRSQIAELIDPTKKEVNTHSLINFLVYGLRYVFPSKPGALVRGVPTAHSAPVMKAIFDSEEHFVWSDSEGTVKGQLIEPLYNTVPKAAKIDAKLYDLLAITDVFRVGHDKEIKIAKDLLRNMANGKT